MAKKHNSRTAGIKLRDTNMASHLSSRRGAGVHNSHARYRDSKLPNMEEFDGSDDEPITDGDGPVWLADDNEMEQEDETDSSD